MDDLGGERRAEERAGAKALSLGMRSMGLRGGQTVYHTHSTNGEQETCTLRLKPWGSVGQDMRREADVA